VDIQARDGARVYALQPGVAHVLARRGVDARVLVGNYIYWHVVPRVREGQYVRPFATLVGTVKRRFGHLHLSEVSDPAAAARLTAQAADVRPGLYLNPLRPGGRVLAPWVDSAAPVLARPAFGRAGRVTLRAFDPQSFTVTTTYHTPVLAPAALAYRVYRVDGSPIGPLEWALRGSRHLPFSLRRRIYTADARGAGFVCFAFHHVCRPNWRYRLAGGLAPRLRVPRPGFYRLTAYAWDWAGNVSARDADFVVTRAGAPRRSATVELK
jgi:hypothetical protein